MCKFDIFDENLYFDKSSRGDLANPFDGEEESMEVELTFWEAYFDHFFGFSLWLLMWWFLTTPLRQTTYVGWFCSLVVSFFSVAVLLVFYLHLFGYRSESDEPLLFGLLVLFMPLIHDKWLRHRYPRDFENEHVETESQSGIPPYL